MAKVEITPELPAEAAATMAKIDEAFKAALQSRKLTGVMLAVYDPNLKPIYTSVVGSAGPKIKISESKARSFLEGKPLADPKGCSLICCYVCPWMCGCTNHMAVHGTVKFSLAGTEAAALVVSGAPTGGADLEIVNEVLAATTPGAGDELPLAAPGGAPEIATIER